MHATVDGQHRQPRLVGPPGQHRQAQLEGGGGKAGAGLDPDHGAALVDQLRPRIGRDLAGRQGAQAVFDAIDVMRFRAVAFGGGDDAGDGIGLLGVEAGAREQRFDRPAKLGHRHRRPVVHAPFPWLMPARKPGFPAWAKRSGRIAATRTAPADAAVPPSHGHRAPGQQPGGQSGMARGRRLG